MNGKQSVFIIILFCLLVAAIFMAWSQACKQPMPGNDFLSLIVALNTIMTTLAIGLAAYKIVTAKEVKVAVGEEASKIDSKLIIELEKFREEISVIKNKNLKSIAFSLDTLLVVAQQKADAITNYRKLYNKPGFYRELMEYVNEMDREILAILHMLVLASSLDPKERLIGYERLVTVEGKEVRKYLMEKLEQEDENENKRYLIQQIGTLL